jgi:hypothetical protein
MYYGCGRNATLMFTMVAEISNKFTYSKKIVLQPLDIVCQRLFYFRGLHVI